MVLQLSGGADIMSQEGLAKFRLGIRTNRRNRYLTCPQLYWRLAVPEKRPALSPESQ
jgi:hypothetical protein